MVSLGGAKINLNLVSLEYIYLFIHAGSILAYIEKEYKECAYPEHRRICVYGI